MPAIITNDAPHGHKSTVAWQSDSVTVAASSEAAGYPAINVTDPTTWSSWLGTGTSENWIRYDFGAAVAIDACGIGSHVMGRAGVALASVQRSDDGVVWVTVASHVPQSDDDVMFIFQSATARYWRVLLAGPAANIGVLVLSSRLIFPHTPVDSYKPLHHARTYSKEFTDSIKNAALGNRVMATGAETEVDFGFVKRQFVDVNMRAFEDHYNQGGYFFYAGWPLGQPLDVGYCRANSEDATIEVEYIDGHNNASLSFGIIAYVG